jgi:hypothetical protein
MADGEEHPSTPEPTKTVPLTKGLRRGLDIVDSTTPPADQFRPNLDAPEQSAGVEPAASEDPRPDGGSKTE